MTEATDNGSKPNPARVPAGSFLTTCWTQVMAARGDSDESREALRQLCDHYYQPVIAYLQRAGHSANEEARDLAHDFFADLLKGHRLDHLKRERGRFRSYLLGALKHFLSHHRARRDAIKRGGKASTISLNETGVEIREGEKLADPHALPPDGCFDRQWAVTVLDRALDSLEAECEQQGKATHFEHLSPWLTGEADHGDQLALAETLGMPANTLKSTISRLRSRFRRTVKNEISQTLIDPTDIDNEMAALFAALGGDGKK